MENKNKIKIRGVGTLLACGVTMLSPVMGNAQEDVMVVEAASGVESETGYVSGYSNTGSKTNASILTLPQSLSTIGRKELHDRSVQTTTQALQYTPGVFANTSAVSSRFDYFKIRGFDSTLTGILQDGLRSTTSQTFVHYQPWSMESIDVLRGPNGFLYGAGSPGGIVNVVSKRPQSTPFREVGIQTGSHNRFQTQFDFTGPVGDDNRVLYRLVGVARDSNTQFDHVPDDTLYIAPSFTWLLNDATTLTVLASANRDKFGPSRPFLPINGSLLSNPNGKIPDNQYLDGVGLDNHLNQYSLTYLLDHRFNEVSEFHSSARYSWSENFTQTLSGMSLQKDMRTLNRAAYQFQIKGNVLATDNHLSLQWGEGALNGSSVVGVAFRHTTEDYYLNYGKATAIDIYNPRQDGSFSAPTRFTSTKQNANETGVYLSNSVTLLDSLNVDLSGRQDWATVGTKNRLKGGYTHQDDRRFTWRAGMSWLTESGIVPYASYATSFSPVLGTDFYGNHYNPTTGKQWETGVKYQPEDRQSLFTLAWFELVQDNVSTTDPNNRLNTVQTGQITSKGVEFSASADVTPAFSVVASYTWNDLKTTRTTNPAARDKVPTGMPEHMASLWGDYTVQQGPLAGVGMGLGVRYVGSTWADGANTIKVPDYTLMDAALRYDLGRLTSGLRGLSASVNANNLLNKHYYVTCSTTSCNTGYDRQINATLTYRW